jgi:dTDP-4-dehydrorhamnose reductase
MTKPAIIVTGANGQLGRELQLISGSYPEFNFVFFTKEELPIHDREKVHKAFASLKPRYLINCAAYTAVDRAEIEKEQAFMINGTSIGILVEACGSYETRLIHISTDYVFNGNASEPYKEEDSVDPVNAYGASKLRGEELTISQNARVIIIRTSWVYSEFGNNFVKTMMRLMKERTQLGVVNDQKGSPTYAYDLGRLIADIIQSGVWLPGIYHYSNEGIISWYDFAKAIKEITGSNCEVNPITTADFPTPAKRPAYSGLDKTKIRIAYKLMIPDWRDSLQACIKKINN